jgi:branched-chain amino acid transport system ATP-binding protein
MPMLVDALMDILRRINADGVTILLVEQELDVALALASRCYVLDQGRVQFEGASESLRADHDVQARFLGAT